MPYIISPLGFHLPPSVKDKIWKGDYIDLLSLLPSSKDLIYKIVRKEEKIKKERRRPITK